MKIHMFQLAERCLHVYVHRVHVLGEGGLSGARERIPYARVLPRLLAACLQCTHTQSSHPCCQVPVYGDDVGATTLRFWCRSDPPGFAGRNLVSTQGEWFGAQRCPTGSYLCGTSALYNNWNAGISTVLTVVSATDNLGMTAVTMKCCKGEQARASA